MNNETVLDDYLEQLLGEATTVDAEPALLPAAAVVEAAGELPSEREPTWDDLPDEVVYETGPASTDDPALMDEASLQAAFEAAADAPLPVAQPEPEPEQEPTWDDLPDEVIYETGEAISAVLTNADSPSLEAAFEAAADPIAALVAPPPAISQAPVLPPRTVARAVPALAQPNANPPSTWQELQEQARQSGYASSPQRRATERSSRWLRLRCGSQAYALELLKVQEVVLPVPLLPLRGTAPAMLGIMNLRGQVVPVMDLGIHLGGAPAGEDALTRIVVLEENGEIMGLRVTAVEDVTNLSDSQIEPPDTARICRISNDIFRGVARLHQQPMILLDATQLLN